MPLKKKSRKKRRKVRYKVVKLKLSAKQQESLDYYCQVRRTTPNKLIKKMIKPFFKFKKELPEESFATANQLDLFDGSGRISEL
jgi:hypothetical protein